MTAVPKGLVYYPDSRPGIARRRCGRGFTYLAPDGTRIDDETERARITGLAVPPAYEDVWISPRGNGHLQATGRDARERKQYRYHPDWTKARAERKFGDLAAFGRALPRIRRAIRADLGTEAGDRAFALAATLAMIDRLSVRVGHPDYLAENGTQGVTTLNSRNLILKDGEMRIRYTAKGGNRVTKTVRHAKLQRALGRLHDLPGADLISWQAADGTPRAVRSEMVNARLADLAEDERVTAKTFRTWNGSVAALEAALAAEGPVTIRAMAEAAAEELCNTPTIARNSYIHPRVIALAEDRSPLDADPPEIAELRRSEARLLRLLEDGAGA